MAPPPSLDIDEGSVIPNSGIVPSYERQIALSIRQVRLYLGTITTSEQSALCRRRNKAESGRGVTPPARATAPAEVA
jgi:hypothetical protein